MTLQSIPFPTPYQYKAAVAPGERVLIWELLLSAGYVGFIGKVAWDWYEKSFYEWKIDGHLYEKLQRTSEVQTPDEYSPPIIAQKSIRFYFTNNDTKTLAPGVLCDGQMVRRG